jgi:hypothetical protein
VAPAQTGRVEAVQAVLHDIEMTELPSPPDTAVRLAHLRVSTGLKCRTAASYSQPKPATQPSRLSTTALSSSRRPRSRCHPTLTELERTMVGVGTAADNGFLARGDLAPMPIRGLGGRPPGQVRGRSVQHQYPTAARASPHVAPPYRLPTVGPTGSANPLDCRSTIHGSSSCAARLDQSYWIERANAIDTVIFGITLRLPCEAARSVVIPSSAPRRALVGMLRTVRGIGTANRLKIASRNGIACCARNNTSETFHFTSRI